MVSHQLKREIYVSKIVFGTSSIGKIPRLLQRQKSLVQDVWIIVPYQHSNELTLELEAAALEKVPRNVTSNLRLHSVRYLKNIFDQKSQNFSDQLIKEAKIKLEYLTLHCVSQLFFLKKKTDYIAHYRLKMRHVKQTLKQTFKNNSLNKINNCYESAEP